MYKQPFGGDNCNGGGEERKARLNAEEFYPKEIFLYPNPAMNQITLQGRQEHEQLEIEIFDLSGRRLMQKVVETKGFIITLDVNLMNGAYLVKITNTQYESTIKKLLIAK